MSLALRSGIPFREWRRQEEEDHRVVVTAFDLYGMYQRPLTDSEGRQMSG